MGRLAISRNLRPLLAVTGFWRRTDGMVPAPGRRGVEKIPPASVIAPCRAGSEFVVARKITKFFKNPVREVM